MILQNIQLKDLILYENNPRDNSNAIAEVKKSIEQCGYITPIIIKEITTSLLRENGTI